LVIKTIQKSHIELRLSLLSSMILHVSNVLDIFIVPVQTIMFHCLPLQAKARNSTFRVVH